MFPTRSRLCCVCLGCEVWYNGVMAGPTREELDALEREQADGVTDYVYYQYQCANPQCEREFKSNLKPKKAVCPFACWWHGRKPPPVFIRQEVIQHKRPASVWRTNPQFSS